MEPSLMADFLDRQRRAQAAVAPHAEHLAGRAAPAGRRHGRARPCPPARTPAGSGSTTWWLLASGIVWSPWSR